MEFITVDHWDEELWQKWRIVYDEAFGEKGAKPEKVIQNMFRNQMCFFHIAQGESEVYAIALSGKLPGTRMLLVDYLAVREKVRNRGVGRMMIDYMKSWAMREHQFDSMVIEVEAEDTQENLARIQFWGKCDFILTPYIHHYKVVPEPYQAMYIKLVPDAELPENGEEIFQYLGQFHRKSFQG